VKKLVSKPITTKPRELTEAEQKAVCGGAHAVTGKEFKGSPNAYAPGAWADGSTPPKFA